jgi:hypothetical protein
VMRHAQQHCRHQRLVPHPESGPPPVMSPLALPPNRILLYHFFPPSPHFLQTSWLSQPIAAALLIAHSREKRGLAWNFIQTNCSFSRLGFRLRGQAESTAGRGNRWDWVL